MVFTKEDEAVMAHEVRTGHQQLPSLLRVARGGVLILAQEYSFSDTLLLINAPRVKFTQNEHQFLEFLQKLFLLFHWTHPGCL